MPAVSVIIPVFKVEPYIARCVRSLFGQTLEDIEYIFVDDCTPDRSVDVMLQVLEDYPERKGQVKVYRMPRNSGQAAVRMQGVEMATGDYVIHCDSDDYLVTNAYELMYRKATAEDLDIVTCNYAREQDGKLISKASGECHSLVNMLCGGKQWSLCSKMVKRTLYEGMEPPVANLGEDMAISIQLYAKARSFGHVDHTLYRYCFRDDSITKEVGEDALAARLESLKKNADQVVDFLQRKCGYSGNDPVIALFKYRCRYLICPVVHLPKYYRYWRGTFPEVDKGFLFSPVATLEDKFWFALIHLHLYRPVKRLTGWLKKHGVLNRP